MSILRPVINEKSMALQAQNIFVLSFDTHTFSVNKIEMVKLLRANNLNPLEVRVVNLPEKVKVRGAHRNKVVKPRIKKYYVKLKAGEKIDEKFELTVGAATTKAGRALEKAAATTEKTVVKETKKTTKK